MKKKNKSNEYFLKNCKFSINGEEEEKEREREKFPMIQLRNESRTCCVRAYQILENIVFQV